MLANVLYPNSHQEFSTLLEKEWNLITRLLMEN